MTLSLATQMILLVALYLALAGGLMLLNHAARRTLDAVRADIDAELRVADSLTRYAVTRDRSHYREYVGALRPRLADDQTRAELEKPSPDVALVYGELRESRTRADGVAIPTLALRYLASVDEVGAVVKRWMEADGQLDRLAAAAAALHREASSGRGATARIERTAAADVQRLAAQLRTLEREYSGALAVAGFALARVSRQIMFGLTSGFFVLSVVVALLGAARLRRAHSSLRAHVLEVAQGNFSERLEGDATDGLGALASAFNQMADSLATSRRKAEGNSRDLGKALRELENIMETIPDVICILDLLGRLDLWNRNLETATGLSEEAIKKRPVSELFAEADRASIEVAVREGLRKGRFEVEGALLGAGGVVTPYHWTGAVLEDEQGALIGLTVSGRDIAERKALEGQLARQAFHDPLTNLPNRALFMNRLAHALMRTERRAEQVAVLFLDLDRFKVINDSLGHSVGDQLLVEVSRRLLTCLRPADTVARLGGDEFAILLEDVERVNGATWVAERIAAQLETPFSFEGREVFVTTSIGIALSHAGEAGPEEIVRDADLAMYHAKNKGKARYEVFDGGMNAPAIQRLDLEIDLRSAVARQEFRIYYQPVVALETGRITEVEALIRWEHRQRGLLPPSDFITLTEETGLIVPIGRWVLTEACRQARAWQAEYPADPPLVMSVNLSARQFQQPNLVQEIAQALRQSGLNPASLKLEITESVVMHDAPSTLAKLHALKELGVQLAIDDFGTGYSSLGYLKRFPVDTLKIDQSFVKGLGHDAEDTAIVSAVITVAKSLNLDVTAEGIETEEQLAQLRALGCDRGQGYYFAKPLAADPMRAFFALTRRGKRGGERALAIRAESLARDCAVAVPA